MAQAGMAVMTVRTIMLTLLVNLVMAGAVIAGPASAATSAGGFLGRPLPEVEQQNFFKQFQLAELAKRETPYGAGVVVFKPAQPTVHFEVAITVDKTDHVLAVQLWLRRSFIDGGDSEPIARAVVLGFLREAPPGEDVQRLDGLADEIQYGHVAGAEPPKAGLPAKPSAGYLAIMGKRGTYQQALGESRLQILNYRDRFGPVMTVQVVPIGNGKHEQAKLDRSAPPRRTALDAGGKAA
jgi:hypothetical protein